MPVPEVDSFDSVTVRQDLRAGDWRTPPSAVLLLVLGLIVASGWLFRVPALIGLLPNLPQMVMNTALMFVASGAALLALSNRRLRLATAFAAGVGLLALAILAEHSLDVNLGIDAISFHLWAQDGYPNPGRPAFATASCFALAAAGLLMLAQPGAPRFAPAIALLGSLTTLVSFGSGIGHLLGLGALYQSYALRGMAPHTAFGLFVLGLELWRAASGLRSQSQTALSGRRIVSQGTLILVMVAIVTGVPVLVLAKSRIEQSVATGLRTSVAAQVRLVETNLNLRSERAAIFVNRPAATLTLRALERDPKDAAARALAQATVDSFRPHGFSALRVTSRYGRTIAASGSFVTDPALAVTLADKAGQQLLWSNGFYLRSRLFLRDGGETLAVVEMEQPLPRLSDTLISKIDLGETGELKLCHRDPERVRCFASRRHPQPFEVPYEPSNSQRLAVRAAGGGSGVGEGRDEAGHRVFGAYAPVAELGLFLILKVDTAELYEPLRRDMELALLLATIVVTGGSLLFRVVVRPMTQALVDARQQSEAHSRAIEHLHAFQRGVFEQAPDGILVADSTGRIVEANERLGALFGHPREAMVGKSIDDLVPKSVREAHGRHRAGYAQAPTTRVMSGDRNLRGLRADGSEFPIEVALAPLHTAEARHVIAIVKDVTVARSAEQAIRDTLKEKDLLLGEIHHRVKNNLQIVQSLLDMQVGLTADAHAANALRDSQNRIQSMALIHQTLYQSQDFAQVDFGRFLETLIDHLQGSYGRRDLNLHCHADELRLPIDRAIPCGLIVNELVTNALKHGFPDGRGGNIRVEANLLNGVDVEVAVTDDGVGLPAHFRLDALSSLGMQLVQVLTEQLHAELHIRPRDPTRIAFTFPLR